MVSDRSRILPWATPGLWRRAPGFILGRLVPHQSLSIVFGRRFFRFVDGVGRKLTALPFHSQRLHRTSVFSAYAASNSILHQESVLNWKFGVMMWRDSSSLDAARSYMTKRPMDPFSADYVSPGNTGVPVPSMT